MRWYQRQHKSINSTNFLLDSLAVSAGGFLILLVQQ
jgi:hypothetical protein